MTAGVCLVVDQVVRAFVPALAFTIGWTHSIEKTDWQEDYRVVAGGLRIVEARVAGSGAGMEPGDGAELRNGVWHFVPAPVVHQRIRLTLSSYAAPYRLCVEGRCQALHEAAGVDAALDAVVELTRCDDALTSPPASR